MFKKVAENLKLTKKRCARQEKILQFATNMKRAFQHLYLLIITVTLCHCKSESTLDTYTEKKILIIGNSNEPAGLDPQVVTGVIESTILRATSEGLCVEDPVDASIHRPGAAASWIANDDFTEWEFKLQRNGFWSDGKPITAQDFVFSYHRILSPSFGAKYSSMLYYMKGAEDYNKDHRELYLIKKSTQLSKKWDALKSINFRGDESVNIKGFERSEFSSLEVEDKKKFIKGNGLNQIEKDTLLAVKADPSLFEWPEHIDIKTRNAIIDIYINNYGKDLWEHADVGVIAIDDYTLKINLRSPVPFLPDLTKHYTWFPVPKHAVLKYGTISERRTKWTEPENVVTNGPFKMKTWKFNYKIEVEKNPFYWDEKSVKLNGIVFLPISNTYTEARMFYNDQLHVTYTLAPELIEYSNKNHPKSTRQETYLGTNFLRFNNNSEGLNDVNVRKAIAYATDSKSLIKYVLKGGQNAATGIVPPMGKYKALTKFGFNPEKAREYLSKTKYADNPEDLQIILLTTDKEGAKTVAEALQAMWLKELGIDVKIEQREWASYQTRMSKLDYGIATGGWIGDYPDPTTFLDMWKKGDGNNRTGWSSDAYEEKLKQAETTKDPLQRIETLQRAEAVFMADMPIVPLYWYSSNYLLHESVKHWHPMIMRNQPYKFIDLNK